MSKRLLFVIDQFYKGGAETSLLNLFKYLDKSKYDIDFIIMNQTQIEGDASSLIPQIPIEVNVLDVQKAQRQISLTRMIKEKFLLTKREKDVAPVPALLFVHNKKYDWAFHIGEWWTPVFIAFQVTASHKAAWIHNDLSQAEYFHADNYFLYDNFFDRYIFVSNNSMMSSVEAFPFIKNRASCIYNINDAENIRLKAEEKIDEKYFEMGLPVLVTCANVRQQKRHDRQLSVMSALKDRGVDFIWLNIGATVEAERCNALLMRAKELGLENRFILAGARENPYKYMVHASAVAVLSDYESWSMVITEAKILGVPVISTRTSGALEQIIDGETGVLTDFSVIDIAEKLNQFLHSQELEQKIRRNLKDFDNTDEIVASFSKLIDNDPSERDECAREILYIIDDINYQGGAHIATKLQIRELLKEGYDISIFSSSVPIAKVRTELCGVTFLSWRDFPEDRLYNRRLMDCLTDPNLTAEEKKYKARLTWESKIRRNPEVFENMVLPHLKQIFSKYKTVCVMSENSAFRELVVSSQAERKIQWIHTDYCDWKNLNEWTRKITANDAELYRNFDGIVVLTDSIRDKFLKLYPHLASKVVVNRNLLPADEIRNRALKKVIDPSLLRFVSVGRIDAGKAYDRLFEIIRQLFQEGYRFYWTVIGDGENFSQIQAQFSDSDMSDYIMMTGQLSNPFPYVKDADVFALLSRYEGLPNTIFEALILGTPVIATNVGGVSTQIQDGETGWLVENNEDAIYQGLKYILDHPEQIDYVKKKLVNYQYDNTSILCAAEKILFGDKSICTPI